MTTSKAFFIDNKVIISLYKFIQQGRFYKQSIDTTSMATIDEKVAEIKADIAKQTKECLAKYPDMTEDEAFCLYFNNFNFNLPFGGRRNVLSEKCLDSKEGNHKGNTFRQFYQDVDKAIAQAGISLEKLKILPKQIVQLSGVDDDLSMAKRRELMELILPVYVILREQGYTHYDLVG